MRGCVDKRRGLYYLLSMPATQTVTVELAAINAFSIATIAAVSCARTISKDYRSQPHEWHFAPTAELNGDIVTIRMEANNVVRTELCREMLFAAREAAMIAFKEAGINAIPQVHKVNPGKKDSAKTCLYSTGLWHMGHYDITARWVQFRIAA